MKLFDTVKIGRIAGILFAALAFLSAPALAAVLTLSPSSLPNGTLTVGYSQTIVASGGNGNYTYNVTSGSLPPGLSLDSASGDITGTPTTTGVSNFTVTATDTAANSGSRAYSIAVGTFSLTLLPTSLPAGTQNVAYSQTISAVGGTAPYTFIVSSGALPSGLTLASSGLLSGTPTVNGSFGFIVQGTDANGNTGFRTYTLNIGTSSLTISPPTLPAGSQNVPYNQTVSASGGTAPYSYAIIAGALPAGLSLNGGTGAITGTPSGNGVANFTIQASDTVGDTGTQAYSLAIGSNSLSVNPPTLPNGTQNSPYSQTISATGGTGGYTFALTSGSLPAGLSLDPNSGVLSGTPSGTGPSTFTIRATDSSNNTGSRTYNVNIGTNSLTVNPASLPNGTHGTPYSQAVSATGGTAPYTFAVTAGALPAGLSLNANTGAIAGTPTGSGVSSFTIQATDVNANTGSRAYNVTISLAALTINPASLPPATQGTAYTQTITASGGTAPYSYAIVAGALPAGLTLNGSTGAISGTPSVGGVFNFTVQATDATPNTGTRAYTLNVGTNSIAINPPSLPAGSQNVTYSQTLVASGGTGPYTFSITSGALPAGLTLNAATGAITGTPTTGGVSSFTVRAADSIGNFGTHNYALTIGTNSLTINPVSLPAGVQGKPYSQVVVASGGIAPYTYAIIGGALPPGLTLNATTGAITGIPTGTGSFSVTIQAHDINGNTGSRVYAAIAVRPDPSTDPGVQGIVASQASTARRFASTQVGNVSHHLEDMHDAFDPCLVNMGVGVSILDPTTGVMRVDPNAANTVAPVANMPTQGCAGRSNAAFPLAFWAGGNAQFGSADLNGASNHFSTGGLTMGIDGRFSNSLIVGFALGYGSDRTTIGTDGTHSDARDFDTMFYASYQPFDGWFLDAVMGYGTLSFDNQRFVALDGSSATGTRSGSNWFGSVAVSTDIKSGAMKVSPYVRADVMSTSLQGYAEEGSTSALTYGAVKFSSTTAVVGMRGSYDIATGWGVVSPTARVEFRHALDGGFNQSMFYTDLGAGVSYALLQSATTSNALLGAIGLRTRVGNHLSGELEYGASAGDNSQIVQSLRGILRLSF